MAAKLPTAASIQLQGTRSTAMTSYTDLRKGFVLGPWEVLPDRGLVRDGEREERLEPLVMDVLVVLASQQGDVLSKDYLIETVWEGRAQSDEPLNRCISLLRRKLGDNSKAPAYIENIPRRGYRLMMPISTESIEASADDAHEPRRLNWLMWIAGGAATAVALIMFFGRSSSTPTAADGPIQSIAIYPFNCADNTEEYLCFGFSEELTSTLLQAREIKIIKKTNVFPSDQSAREIARDNGVDGILTGSVQQIGGRLKISAELVDGRNGFVVLSDTIDGSVQDVFSLQERVAGVVERSIFGDDRPRLTAAREPPVFAAFQAYARGQYQFDRRSRASIESSIGLFEETIRLDPEFGPAYLRLAYAYLLLPEYDNALSVESMYDRAAKIVSQGTAIDPTITESAGTVFGFIHHKRGEWLLADEAFGMAVNADTVFPLSHHWYSRFLATVGRMDDALVQATRAYELDPDRAIIISRLAIINLWTSNLLEAERYFDMANSMDQDSPIHDLAYALYLIRVSDISAARGYTKSGLEKYGFDGTWVDPVFDGIEDPEKREQSMAIVAQMEADGQVADYIVLTLWALLGDANRAMDTATSIEGIGQDFETGFEVMFSDELKILRDHQAFPTLLDKTGLTEYWDRIGCARVDGRVLCN